MFGLLEQNPDRLFLMDGGLETTLIFDDGFDLPSFASIAMMLNKAGREGLERYYQRFINVAGRHGTGFIFDSPTWRASPDWASKIGLNQTQLTKAVEDAIGLMRSMRDAHRAARLPMIVAGCVGPRGDGYVAGEVMTAAEAQDYHQGQVAAMLGAGADYISALTMTNAPEATGIARAAQARGAAAVISFTVETDGRLPTGQSLPDAIREVDELTDSWPAFYMVNCAHPSHFASVIEGGGGWTARIGGLRCNASAKSHAELNEATELDRGDAQDLAARAKRLVDRLPDVRVLGGCCGTDHTHVGAIAQACGHRH